MPAVELTLPLRHPATDAVLFTVRELACRSDGRTTHFAPGFLARLRDLRLVFGWPMLPTSCCRTPEYNVQVGGARSSFHLTTGNAAGGTCAIDVAVPDDAYRRKLAMAALNAGWTVGVYPTFLHLDTRADYGIAPIMFHRI